MNIITVFIIGIALSMDVFAVSVTIGAVAKDRKTADVLKIALVFGLFQSCMFLLGDLLGLGMRDFILGFDHWVAFFLLSLIGSKMIYGSFQIKDKAELSPPGRTQTKLILEGGKAELNSLSTQTKLILEGGKAELNSLSTQTKLTPEGGNSKIKKDPFNISVLLSLAFATSIDAFAVGLSFALLTVPILTASGIIGVVTFVISFAGVFVGEKIGHFFENKIEFACGLVLILIGINILIEHIM